MSLKYQQRQIFFKVISKILQKKKFSLNFSIHVFYVIAIIKLLILYG